jgi:hypothetical protein
MLNVPTEDEVLAYRMTPSERTSCERSFEQGRLRNENYRRDAHEFTFVFDLLADRMEKAATAPVAPNRPMAKPAQSISTRKLDAVYRTVGRFIAKQLAPLEARIAALEAQAKHMPDLELRLRTVEDRPKLRYCGTWHEKSFARGSLVTHGPRCGSARRRRRRSPAKHALGC